MLAQQLIEERNVSLSSEPIFPNTLASTNPPWRVVSSDYLLKPELNYFFIKKEFNLISQHLIEYLGKPTGVGVISNSIIGVTGWEHISLSQQALSLQTAAGVFEASAMAYFHIKGNQAIDVLNYLTPRNINKLKCNAAMFVIFTNPYGTVDDEGVLLRIADDEFIVSCGGCKPLSYLDEAIKKFPDVQVCLSDTVSLNIKGPKRMEAMLQLVHATDRENIRHLRDFDLCCVRCVNKEDVWVLKTKIGMEMWGKPETIKMVWSHILQRPETYTPCGWDILHAYRMECQEIQFLLYPLELNHNTSLWEIGHGWMVDEKNINYIGKKSSLKNKTTVRFIIKKIRLMDDTISSLPAGTKIFTHNKKFAGYITSSAFSVQHNKLLAFAHIDINFKDEVDFNLHPLEMNAWVSATLI